jgi:hypothetical protein
MGGLTGGLGGYGGGSLAGTFSKMGSGAATAATPTATGATTAVAPTGAVAPTAATVAENPAGFQTAANINAGLPASTPANAFEASMGLPQTANVGPNAVTQAGINTQAAAPTFGQGLSNVGQGIKQLASEGGYDAFKKAGGTGMDLAMPLGGAVLAGMQPEPFDPGDKDKYNPNATLNLNRDTGLKLFAQGGVIDTPQAAPGTMGLGGLYGARDGTPLQNTPLGGYGYGGSVGYAQGGMLNGPGDGMSDSIPATIEGRQPARLADGEFVIPADVVSHLGNGSTKAGSQRLYSMLDKVRKARTGNKNQGKQINPNKYMP